MKLVTWNVNGLRAALGKGFEEYFASADADIFSIQETKMQPGQADFAPADRLEYLNSAEKKGYSGTACWVKQEPLSVSYGIGKEEHSHEGRAITLEYPEFYLVNVYTPNAQDGLKRLDYRMSWEDDLRDYLMALDRKKPVIYCGDLKETPSRCTSQQKKKKPIILCGDLNVAATEIDLKNPKPNEGKAGYSIQEREKFQQLLEAGFTDAFRHLYPDLKGAYTWWSYRFHARENNAGWRIDYFIVSNEIADKIIDVKIRNDIFGSDHCPVEIEIDL